MRDGTAYVQFMKEIAIGCLRRRKELQARRIHLRIARDQSSRPDGAVYVPVASAGTAVRRMLNWFGVPARRIDADRVDQSPPGIHPSRSHKSTTQSGANPIDRQTISSKAHLVEHVHLKAPHS